MFSCALFQARNDAPLPAEDAQVTVKVIGTVGQGTATCSYRIERDAEGLVLYVPSLLSLPSVTRQHVRLSGCEVTVAQSSAEEEKVAYPLRLQIDDTDLLHAATLTCNGTGGDLPEYGELRRRYKATASKLFGSHSYEDVLLHVGDLPRGAKLSVCFEFLTRFSSSNECPPVQYALRHSLPSLHCSYNLLLAALSPVTDVTTAGSPASFSWEYLYGGKQHRNLVQVSYTTAAATLTSCNNGGLGWEVNSPPPGVSVHLGGGRMSAGCCCSLPTPDAASSLLAPHDGVMMMSSVFTPRQLPKSLKLQPYSPSEFVFVVDCSGSMSGSNIQIAADTLITCIKSLPVGCHFNVIAFGSTFRQLFHSSEVYSEANMEAAIQFANQLQASLGGTELLGPLRWIFKAQRVPGLPCQVFIITDGGVTNTTSVLRCVRRNRHQARCHTFGIGGEVCVELVTGIAAASGGQCVLVSSEERLQTKVMEVLKDSMQPSMSNVMLQWHPPRGYSVADSSPRNLGTLFSGNSYSAFAFLRRTDPTANGTHDAHGDVVIPAGTATLTGLVNGEQVEIEIDPVTLPPLSDVQGEEIISLLSRSATWSKLCDLELQALTSSRKNSQNESGEEQAGEPLAKKPRLNGSVHRGAALQKENPFREELTTLSLRSGILCPLTYLQSESGTIRQIIPLPHSSLSKPSAKPVPAVPVPAPHRNGTSTYRYRKRKHNHHYHHRYHHSTASPQPDSSFTLSSLAKNTFSVIGSTLKTVASLTTFGLVGQDSVPVVENGQSLEDEIEYQANRHSQLHWDEARGNIVYPEIYYRSHPGNSSHCCNGDPSDHPIPPAKRSRRSAKRSHHHRPSSFSSSSSAQPPSFLSPSPSTPVPAHLLGLRLPDPTPAAAETMEEDEDLAISDTESDSSVDPDWEDLHKPSELLPLIHIQLFSGAWPLLRAFSYAVGVPLEEIRKLPLPSASNNLHRQRQTNGHTGRGGDRDAHLWATAVALACLEEHFSELRTEWEVVAFKGRCWVEQELQQSTLSLEELQRIARELVQRRS